MPECRPALSAAHHAANATTWLLVACLATGVASAAEPSLDTARELLRGYREADAETMLLDLVASGSEDPAVHRELGLLYARWYRFEPAERHLSLALGASPSDPDLLHARGRVRFSLLNWPGAVADLQALLALPSSIVDPAQQAEAQRLVATLTKFTPEREIAVRADDGRLLGTIRNGCSDRRGAQYAELMGRIIPDLEALVGRQLPPAGLVLLGDSQDMDKWNEAYCGQASPGCAFHNYRVIVLNAHAANYDVPTQERERAEREAVLKHELVHHLIDSIAGPHATPKWLHEGLAEYFSLQSPARNARAICASLLRRGQTPYELIEFLLVSRPEEMDHTYYAQAASLVAFLADRSPHNNVWFVPILEARAAGLPFDEAFAEEVGMSKEAAFQLWEKTVLSPLFGG